MIWTTLFLIQAILLYFIFSKRSRSKSEPPLDKGLIPWVGHAFEFGKDAAKFLTRMKMKHGDIFTVCAAGRYVTVLLDPNSFDAVINDPVSLDFTRYAQILMERIFKLQLPHHRPEKERAIMKQHFQGESLTCYSITMYRHLLALLKAETCQNQTDWKMDGLFNFCYSLLFRAGFLTLFGGEQNNNGADPTEVYKEFRKFDHLLTKMARTTLKPEERRTAQSARERLWDLLASAGLTEDSGSNPWLHSYRQLLREEEADEETQSKAMLLQLWATQGNVGPAAFWLLSFLLTNPEALKAVRKEFSSISEQCTSDNPLLDGITDTPVFNSALEEALRLTAAPYITREVLHEKTLRMADGHEYRVRKGDRVCLFPFVSPQMDPEIHQDPQIYKYDRFLNEDGTAKKDFFKRGTRLKYYTMPWGAGTNGCVGKMFAINAIKQFVYLVFSLYHLEPCDPDAQVTGVNASRYGFGILQPEGDLSIRYRATNLT